MFVLRISTEPEAYCLLRQKAQPSCQLNKVTICLHDVSYLLSLRRGPFQGTYLDVPNHDAKGRVATRSDRRFSHHVWICGQAVATSAIRNPLQ